MKGAQNGYVSTQAPAAGEGAVDRTRERHRMAMQVSKIGTWTRDMRDGVVTWSAELAELFGLPIEQTPRSNEAFFALVHPDDRERVGVAITGAGETGTEYDIDFRYRHSSGEYRWMTGRGRGFYDENGAIVELAGVGIDITEQHRAPELASERALLLRQIGDNLPEGALYQVVADAEGNRRFVYWSAGIERLIGVSPEAALANPAELYGRIHPDDLTGVAAAEQASVAEGKPFDVTMRMQHAQTGEWHWVNLRSAPRRLADGAMVWDGIYMDVTRQKGIDEALALSLERLGLAQQAGHIGVFDWDVQTGRVIWSDEEHRIFGLKPGTFEGTIEGWAKRVVAEDQERMERDMQQAMARREPQMDFAFRILTPAGDERSIEGAARFTYAPDGKPIRMVGVNIDVTARREAENALRAADRRKNEFLAMLSHELRNPLAAMSNALELATAADPNPTTFEWSGIVMRRQLTHLTHLVDDLLDVTRITSGKIQLRPERIDCADVLDHAIAGLRLLFAERKQLLTHSYSRELVVEGDPTRIEQVVVNLLTNAAKYTPPGGKIHVEGRREGDEVVLAVRDNGIGIPQEQLEEMFELFAQGRRSIARSEGGLGLGLTISRSLVEMHGGKIVARSAGEGAGSEFIVRLPAASGAVQSSTSSSGPVARAAVRGVRLLVVDDHVDTANSLARLLKAKGNIVEIVHDGHSALTAARTFQPQIVLLDLGLPGLDGYTVAEHLRRDPALRRLTIIAISGYGQEEDRQRSSEAGIDHHLVKPVSFSQLEALLSRSAAASSDR